METNHLTVPVNSITSAMYYSVTLADNMPRFKIMAIGRGSYIVDMQIQSRLDLNTIGVHNVQIGQFCSIADGITLLIDLDHDYKSITTSDDQLFAETDKDFSITRKGQILIQNDVWIGHGVTIMSGVTIRNGAVIAANSHVTKDVPPYAIVGGNPAKIIKYRFADEQISSLLDIAWWDWSDEFIKDNRQLFRLPIYEFVNIVTQQNKTEEKREIQNKTKQSRVLLFADFKDPYPIWQNVVCEYLTTFSSSDIELVIYLNHDINTEAYSKLIADYINSITNGCDDNILLEIDNLTDESSLFKKVDFYVTTRELETVKRSCLADRYGVKVLSGVDIPIFHDLEGL